MPDTNVVREYVMYIKIHCRNLDVQFHKSHESLIDDEVALCDVREVMVFPFFENVCGWLDTARGRWSLSAQYNEGIHKSYKKTIKNPMNLKFFCVGTLVMVQIGYTQKF